KAYVLYGHAGPVGTIDGSGRATIDLASLAPSDGFVVQGDQALDFAGFSVASAGDINGDGFADFIVGADGGDDGAPEAGEAYVFLGRAGTFGAVDGTGRLVVDLATFAPSDGFIVQGDAMTDLASRSVASAGDINGDGFIIQGDEAGDLAVNVSSADINGDGFSEIIVGAYRGDDGGTDAGEAYVLYGIAPATGVVRRGTIAGQTLAGGGGDDQLDGQGGDDRLFGSDGNDLLEGGGGADTMQGG